MVKVEGKVFLLTTKLDGKKWAIQSITSGEAGLGAQNFGLNPSYKVVVSQFEKGPPN